ncbi:MAG: hypothetical protein WCI04_01510 [archaeon]
MEVIEEKIASLAKDMQEANANAWTIAKIVKALMESKITSEKKLREKTIELLKELDPNAATIYERFSKMLVYTSNEKVKGFNRGNIITSLTKETTLPRSLAEKITIDVENQIKDSKIEFLTPSLIRELVNAKLISFGFSDIRDHYARVGEPVHDVAKKLEKEPYFGETLREYNLLLAIPKNARELHYNGTLYIEDVEGYSHRPFAYSITAQTKETPEKTIFGAIKEYLRIRKYFFLAPSIYGLTFACAPFVKSAAQAKHIADFITQTTEILEEKPILSLELFTPKVFETLGEYRLNAAKISNHLLSDNSVVGIDSEYSLKLLDTKGTQFMVLNNANEEYYPLSRQFFSPSKGIDLFVNINLEKINAEDENSFFEELNTISREIKELKKVKKTLLANKKYLAEFNTSEMKTAIGITNLLMLAEKLSLQKQFEFAAKTFKEISKLFPEDLIFGLGSEKARIHFSDAVGKAVYSQETLGFDECLKEKKCCFTGKAGSIKELNELLKKKVKQIDFFGIA